MSDNVGDRDGTFRWGKECPDRYEIILHFSNGVEYNVPKYIKGIICSYAELYEITLNDYIWSKPKELLGLFSDQPLENLIEIEINDRTEHMEKTLERLVYRSVQKQSNKKIKNSGEVQTKLSESEGHFKLKNDIVDYLRTLDLEAYSEVVFYENAFGDYYKWQRGERKRNPNSDVGFGNFKQGYGQQIKVDVAAWINSSDRRFDYPIVAVEVMKSSNLREEIVNLNKIHSMSSVFTIVVDAYGKLSGALNNTPVIRFDEFKRGITKRIELAREAISEGKSENKVFEIGKKFNVGKIV